MGEKDVALDDNIRVWIGNLGRYNEGTLQGEWISLPVSTQELDDFLVDRVGLITNPEEAFERGMRGERVYEEYFIADYEYGGMLKEIGFRPHEYANLDDLNALAAVASDMDATERECLRMYADDNCVTGARDMAKLAYAIHDDGDMGGYFSYAGKDTSPYPDTQAYLDSYYQDPMNCYVETVYPEESLEKARELLEKAGFSDLAANIDKAAYAACESYLHSGYLILGEHGYVETSMNPPDFDHVDFIDVEGDYLPADYTMFDQSPAIDNPTIADRQAAIDQAASIPAQCGPAQVKGR